jgi:hypothetical protein
LWDERRFLHRDEGKLELEFDEDPWKREQCDRDQY